ncbi:MAG: nucleotidyltransferase family protein [Spirulinaceae cyanobacterium RM2_2_10]|nr:nucleotidyltransferase family protein [Spirulinaceae cyanobacterium RM2_2_10]
MTADCPELVWLLDCLRRACRGQLGCPPRSPLDSHKLFTLANRHGVAPLLYWQLRDSETVASELPEWRSQLEAQFQASLRRNFLLSSALVKLLDALRQQAIAAITFKGPALAAQLYGNLGLRQVSDIDILVAPADLAAAQAVLAMLGYEPLEPLTAPQAELRQRTNYERAWLQPQRGVNVDLHWG